MVAPLIRPLTRDDLPALHAFLAIVGQAHDLPPRETLADLQTQHDDPWSDPAQHSRVAVSPSGEILGYARTFMNPEPRDAARAFFDLEIHPAQEQSTLQDQLLDWAITQSQARAAAGPTGLPRSIRHHCQVQDTRLIERLRRRGFLPVRHFYRMRRDLRQPIPAVELPPGLSLQPYTPDLNRALMQVFNETFSDHWSFEPVTEADWDIFFIQREGFRPDLSFMVMEGMELVAFSYNVVNPEENAHAGVAAGWIQDLGTRRRWRKHGLASALLCHSMRAFQTAGLEYAQLGVDSENPTGALGVYERVGFVPYKHFVALEQAMP